MGLLDYLNRAVDKAVTTVKEFVATQSTYEVSKSKENIPLISKETQAKQKNEDTIEIKNNKSIETIYKQIEELCEEYKMSMEDVKKAQLLETIAGCSSEELAKKSPEEIKSYIDSLKFVLKYQSFTFFWQDRNIDDVKNIAKKANQRCTYLQTGGSFFDNLFRRNKTLSKRIKDAGFEEVNSETVRQYFKNMVAEAIASGNPEKIKKAYDNALKTFGYALNDTENPDEKALLTAAISELEASKRNLAAKLSISSCQNNQNAQMKVAKGISDNYRAITCSSDALGQYTSTDDNLTISQTAFQYMSEEDSLAALSETKSYIQSLETKVQRGEALTAEEQRYYDSVRYSQYAGAMVGASINNNYSNPDNVLGQIDNDTQELGIREQVYKTASAYVEANQDTLPITTRKFTETVDKATGNNYSNVIKTSSTITEPEKVKTQTQTKAQVQSETKTIIEKTVIEEVNTKSITPKIKSSKAVVSSPLREKTKENTEVFTEQEQEEKTTFEKAVKGGVKNVKKYAKDNNIKTLDLAIDSLNSSSASNATKKWALSQFEAASNSEQILNFHKISHGSSAIAAAKTMDEKTRNQLNTFRSYYIKQSVENLNDNSVA